MRYKDLIPIVRLRCVDEQVHFRYLNSFATLTMTKSQVIAAAFGKLASLLVYNLTVMHNDVTKKLGLHSPCIHLSVIYLYDSVVQILLEKEIEYMLK